MGELTNEHEDSEGLVIASVCVHGAGEVGILEVPVKIGKAKASTSPASEQSCRERWGKGGEGLHARMVFGSYVPMAG